MNGQLGEGQFIKGGKVQAKLQIYNSHLNLINRSQKNKLSLKHFWSAILFYNAHPF
jgi:hypothetical protein